MRKYREEEMGKKTNRELLDVISDGLWGDFEEDVDLVAAKIRAGTAITILFKRAEGAAP